MKFIICVLLYMLPAFGQMTQEERKANRERVKAEQKMLNEQSKSEKRMLREQAKNSPTWIIIDVDAAQLKGVLIQHMREWGYSIENESEHQISFWKEANGRDAFIATVFMGNSYSENPKKHIAFTFTPGEKQGQTRIDCTGSVTVRMALGKENRADMTNSPAFKQDLLREYASLKSWAEHEKQTAQSAKQ